MSEAGEIIGRLRLDDSDWSEKIESAKAKAIDLGTVDPKITVKADTATAIVQLTAVRAATDAVAAAQKRLDTAQKSSTAATVAASLARMRLNDLQAKGTASTTQLAAAQEAVRLAQQREADSAARVAAATEALASARKRDTDAALTEAAASEKAKASTADWQSTLIRGLVTIAAAAPPVAAGTVGIAGAFGGMGAAGVLALAGIARELQAGKGPLLEYRSLVDSLRTDLHSAEDSAGTGLFAGAEQSVGILNARMPQLNSEVHGFASQLGGIAPTGLDAVLTMFTRANPLFKEAGDYLGGVAVQLDQFAHSQGFGNFLQYAEQNLPQVERLLGDVVGLTGDLLKAWAPLGAVALQALDAILEDVDGLVKAFPGLTTAVLAGAAAWNAWKAVNPILSGISGGLDQLAVKAVATGAAKDAIGGLGTAAEGAAQGGIKTLASRAGLAAAGSSLLGGALDLLVSPLGLVAGGAVLVGAAYQTATARGRELAQNSTDLSAKLAAAHTTNTNVLRDTIAQQLASKNLSAQYKLVGVSATDVVNASLGQKDAIAKVNGAMNAYVGAGHGVQQTNKAFNINGLRTSFTDLSGAVHNAVLQQQRLDAATKAATVALYGQEAADLAVSSAAEQGVKDADASTQAYRAWAAQIDAAKKAHDKNATAITGSSDAAIANRTAIEGQIDAMKAHVSQMEKDGRSTQAITGYTDDFILKLERNAHQLGLNSSQVAAFISKITGIPKSHVTQLLADANVALQHIRDVKAAIASLHDKSVTLTVDQQTIVSTIYANERKGAQYGAKSAGGTIGYAAGGTIGNLPGLAAGGTGYSGTVRGPGNAWNDMAGLFRLANGEEVISNRYGQADAFRGLLKGINSQAIRSPQQLAAAVAAPQQPPTVIQRHVHVGGVHIHHPVVQDPVAAAAEASQYIQAYSGI